MQRRSFVASTAVIAAGLARLSSAQAAEMGVSDSEIVLGSSAVLSGPVGPQIKVIHNGAGLAFDAVNEQGGIGGRKIKLVALDDELKPEKAVENYGKLLTDHRVFAFFGCVGSSTTAAAAKLLQQSGAPSVGGYGVGDSARERVAGSAYFVRASNAREAQALVEHLTTVSVNKIAIAYLDTPGGAEAVKLIEAAMATHKLTPTAVVSVKSDGSTVAAAGKTLADSRPQAVLMYLAGTVSGEVIKAMYAAGSKPMFYGMSIVSGEVTAKVVPLQAGGLAISQVTPYPWGEVEAVTRDYRRLAERAQVPVGYGSFEGYLNGLVMIEALKRTGRDLTRARLHATLRALRLRLAGMDIDFSTGGNTGSRFIEMVRVTPEGRFVR
ncbi:ABC transporter substrate-binding protein [Variovorax sp. J22G21]|uniref:ABC transporter substrate-binding protein n=1 Tax=Variovorax fucosicus TaxID=3053517 RepID=UPI002574A68A|nr:MULTISPECIES: ABC transporter substrate-binding protein [unclassified Variovorax]MDM0037518.1 ABC transporter substrate-binding protein [Variovorax sp. J22R193]MDM0056812.1 ABC transporter substrate-binding protein [Variovorax sp. J22G47]MDM0062294.1 ABC transporter substrate-binding protein [Variovorax sp. J22G21]